MSGLLWILLCAAGAAWGAWAALRSRAPAWASWAAVLLFAAAGVCGVLARWIAGDGVVLPGLQVNPGLRAFYVLEAAGGEKPWLDRALLLLAPLAHAVLLALRRDRATALRPLPATALFTGLFLLLGAEASETSVRVAQAKGPGRVAYLTTLVRPGGSRIVLSAGDPFAGFLRVVHVHEARSEAPELHLHWTGDGEALVVRVHEEQFPAFAVDLEGNATGLLPVDAREWQLPGAYVPPDVSERFSNARREVSGLIRRHGDLYRP